MKLALAFTLFAGASAFAPIQVPSTSTALFNHGPVIGKGGMADTRDPEAMKHEDPRKSISEAPSFEEYMKMRSGGAPAPAPAAAAPAPAAPAYSAPAAAAPAPAVSVPDVAADSKYGKYDGQVWTMDAKLDVYRAWDPSKPRSPANFNPFETWDGNSPDPSGFYPGEGRYKDPARPGTSYAIMMEERKILDEIAANPKPGFVKGCPGCRN